MISLFWSCSLPSVDTPKDHCFPDLPQEGTLRIHPVSCAAEIETPFTRRGDWILENALQKVVLRHQSSSLTSSTGAGASIIQIGENPILFELRPIELPTPLNAQHVMDDQSGTLSFFHEGEEVLSYTIPSDEPAVYINSQADFFLTPLPRSKRIGSTIYTQSRERGMFIDGTIVQEEQGLYIENIKSIRTEEWSNMHQKNGLWVDLQWENTDIPPHALLLRTDEEQWFLPFLDESFSGYIPSQATEWTLWHPICSKNWIAVEQAPSLGNCTQTQVRVSSEEGSIWAYANNTLIAPQGSLVAFEEESYTISAGPAYETTQVSSSQNHVALNRVFPEITIFSPLEISVNPEKTLARLLGHGIQNTVISTKDFVSPFSLSSPLIQENMNTQRGFLIEDEDSWLLSWPWEPIIREPGMGAIPIFSSYQSQLSYVDRQGRVSVSNLSFFENLQEESQYVHPDFLFISDRTELDTLYDFLDQKRPMRFMGPQNSIPQKGPLPESTLIRTLLAQEHSFGNGPLVLLSDHNNQWYIQAYAPSWMDIDALRIITEGGFEYAQWDFSDEQSLFVSVPKIDSAWVLAELRGNHWAVSPILFPFAEQE